MKKPVSGKEALTEKELNELERNGVVQRFEFTLELCWKTLKDFLEAEGLQFKPTPKETIREAFKSNLIEDAQILIDGFDIRNDLSHDYSGEKFEDLRMRLGIGYFLKLKESICSFYIS